MTVLMFFILCEGTDIYCYAIPFYVISLLFKKYDIPNFLAVLNYSTCSFTWNFNTDYFDYW